jgi:hypothetical protein
MSERERESMCILEEGRPPYVGEGQPAAGSGARC